MIEDHAQVPALREQIRLAGHRTRLVGWVIACSCFLVSLVLLALAAISASGMDFIAAIAGGLCTCVMLGGFGLLFGVRARRDYAGRRRQEFARVLAAMPPERQAAVLLPLRDDRSADVREIVRPLIAELKVASEITPAATPEGRGDEPAAG